MIRTQLRINIDLVSKKIAVSVHLAKNSEAKTMFENKFGLTVPTHEPFVDQDTADDAPYSLPETRVLWHSPL